jgi:threonine/homoserine/homoserine lactone efflux protein
MQYVIEGMQIGLVLSILVGPLMLALVEAAIEGGARRGIALGLGIWISDLLFILAVHYGLTYLQAMVEWPYFKIVVGSVGALILIGVGANSLFGWTGRLSADTDLVPDQATYSVAFFKGWALNTFNPFTVFFWLTAATGFVLQRQLVPAEATSFYTGILLTVIITDIVKVLLAKRIRSYLREGHLVQVRRIGGAALILFGFVLAVRVFW